MELGWPQGGVKGQRYEISWLDPFLFFGLKALPVPNHDISSYSHPPPVPEQVGIDTHADTGVNASFGKSSSTMRKRRGAPSVNLWKHSEWSRADLSPLLARSISKTLSHFLDRFEDHLAFPPVISLLPPALARHVHLSGLWEIGQRRLRSKPPTSEGEKAVQLARADPNIHNGYQVALLIPVRKLVRGTTDRSDSVIPISHLVIPL